MKANLFNAGVVRAADQTVSRLVGKLLACSAQEAVVGVAPAGAGKSYAIGTAVGRCRSEGLRVAVATPTNEQAFALARSISARFQRHQVTVVPRRNLSLPEDCVARNVQCKAPKDVTSADSLLVGTLHKFGDAFSRGDLGSVDVLLVDEAYQADARQYYAVAGLAERHLLMGDSGQLAPFSTAPEGLHWRGLRADPLMTAVEVLQRNHPQTHVEQLPITRRLDPDGASIARAFYPGHPFDAAVLPGVRSLALGRATGRGRNRIYDAALDSASASGWAHFELPSAAVLAADPETVEVIVGLLRRLFLRRPTVMCEQHRSARALAPDQVAVAVSHNAQKHRLRIALDQAGLDSVIVDTANKLQGLTYELVIAWHPLAGLMEADEFHLDPGRLCVMLTRHRHACIVVGRAADRELVAGLPPATPTYLGCDANPALRGWYVHERVFEHLEPHRIGVA